MSWYFDLAGNDKATLATAVHEEVEKAKEDHRGHEAIVEKFGEALLAALDRQTPTDGYAFRVQSSGHVDSMAGDGKFEIRRIKLV